MLLTERSGWQLSGPGDVQYVAAVRMAGPTAVYGRQMRKWMHWWPSMTSYTGRHPRRIAGIGLPVKTQAEEEQAEEEQAKTEEEQ